MLVVTTFTLVEIAWGETRGSDVPLQANLRRTLGLTQWGRAVSSK